MIYKLFIIKTRCGQLADAWNVNTFYNLREALEAAEQQAAAEARGLKDYKLEATEKIHVLLADAADRIILKHYSLDGRKQDAIY